MDTNDLTHRHLCHFACAWLLNQPKIDLVCWELAYREGILDCIGVNTREKKVVAGEVKRTRADLLQDINSGKLLKYEKGSSHCYLIATPAALNLDKVTNKQCLDDLLHRGLPTHWGIATIKGADQLKVIRAARKHSSLQSRTIDALVKRIAKAHQWRHMRQLGLVD
jgi:hypothetical protein